MLALSLRNTVILVSLASSAPSAVRAASSPLDEPGKSPSAFSLAPSLMENI